MIRHYSPEHLWDKFWSWYKKKLPVGTEGAVLVESSSTMKSELCKVILENQILKFTPELKMKPTLLSLCKAHCRVKEGAPEWSSRGSGEQYFHHGTHSSRSGEALPLKNLWVSFCHEETRTEKKISEYRSKNKWKQQEMMGFSMQKRLPWSLIETTRGGF